MKKFLCLVLLLHSLDFLCSNKDCDDAALAIQLAMIDRITHGQPTPQALELLERHYEKYPNDNEKKAIEEFRKNLEDFEAKKSSTDTLKDKEKEK